MSNTKICLYCNKQAIFIVSLVNDIKAYLCDEHKHSVKNYGEIKLIDDTEYARKKYLSRTPKHKMEPMWSLRNQYDKRRIAFREKEAKRQREYQQKEREFLQSLTPEQREQVRLHAINETYNRFIEKLRSKKRT